MAIVVSIVATTSIESCLVQLFGLCSSRSWSTVTCPKEAIADPLSKYLLMCSPVPCYYVLKESCNSPVPYYHVLEESCS